MRALRACAACLLDVLLLLWLHQLMCDTVYALLVSAPAQGNFLASCSAIAGYFLYIARANGGPRGVRPSRLVRTRTFRGSVRSAPVGALCWTRLSGCVSFLLPELIRRYPRVPGSRVSTN